MREIIVKHICVKLVKLNHCLILNTIITILTGKLKASIRLEISSFLIYCFLVSSIPKGA